MCLDDELLPIIEARNSDENLATDNSKPLDSEFKPLSVQSSSDARDSGADLILDSENMKSW